MLQSLLKNNECNHVDISKRTAIEDIDLDSLVPKGNETEAELNRIKEYSERVQETQGMDVLPIDIYEAMLTSCLINKDYRSVFWITAMANMGLRYSDVVKLRKIDLIDEFGKIRDKVLIQEKKSSKQRVIFINKAVKEALLLHLWHNNIGYMDYLIASQGNNKGYEIETYIDKDGNKKKLRVNGKYVYKLDTNGNKIPKPLSRSQSESIMKNIIINSLGIALKNDSRCKDNEEAMIKLCTHSIRKLYGWGITNDFITNFDSDEAYAHTAALEFLSQDYGHSSKAMTLRYSKDFDSLKQTVVNRMNLGLNILHPYFQEGAIEYISKQGKR